MEAASIAAESADGRVAEKFEQSLRAWESASAATGVVERSYLVAGYSVRLRFAGPALVEPMTRALAHHEPSATPPDLTIHLGDSFSTAVDLPARLGVQGTETNPAGWIHRGKRLRARFQPDYQSLHMLETSRDVALFWTGDARCIRFWEKGAPLLLIFHWWMASHGRQLVHAAALGNETGGVLLVGKGGAGKSTTALACLQSDLSYAGDDYHLIALEPVPFAFNLYNSAKVEAARLPDFEQLRGAVANPGDLPEEKALVFLNECLPEKISPGFPIRAVLVPRVTGRRETSVEPASPAAALAALAPSTLFQLRERDADSLAVMAELLRRVPSYTLELGTDLSQIAAVILELLARPAAAPKPRPLVSVVVPVYNGARFLAAALESVFAQDYRPIEIIVVDDGSDDGSAEIARSFDGVRYLFQNNQGQAAARNVGVHAARGEFVAFLDADDLMLPGKISAQLNYLLQHPETACTLSGREIFCEPQVEPPTWLRDDERPREELDAAGAELEDLRAGGMSSVVFRRRALARAGGFDPDLRLVEDIDWLLRLREAGLNVAVLPQVLWRRRIHGANLSYQRDRIEQAWLTLMRKRIDRHHRAAGGRKS
jgi:GT2 family glycosyltransferase